MITMFARGLLSTSVPWIVRILETEEYVDYKTKRKIFRYAFGTCLFLTVSPSPTKTVGKQWIYLSLLKEM